MAEDPNERVDTSGEFFSVGSPLHAVRAGYIHRRADDLLYEAAIAGRYAHIIAPDRSGKSSLIAATAARLEGAGVRVAILDLGQIGEGGQDAGRWYYNVAYRLLRQLRIRIDLQAWWQDKALLSNRQRLVEFYAEVILQQVQKRVVVFVDEIQCTGDLPFADQLLGSIRSAHTARATDPDFARLTFVLLGECDPLSLVNEPELSPFNVTQSIPLDDFTRDDLNLFAAELNLAPDDAGRALDRIYHWTRGQPYLTQKLARAVSRERVSGDVEGHVDRLVMQQLAGKAALHSEPLMSHIHRQLVGRKNTEALLNLYGRIRKGVNVPADLGSSLQRRLMAVGLLEIDESGELKIRNRIYATVFTARWANENLPAHWRAPVAAAVVLFAIALVPFWYTQWLPKPYVRVLTSIETELSVAETAWLNLRSFPGHSSGSDNLYREYLNSRARAAVDDAEIDAISTMAGMLPEAGTMPERLKAEFWDRKVRTASREERRDDALLASLQSLSLSTPLRRNRASMLVGEDYPLLLASVATGQNDRLLFNPGSLLLTSVNGARISQSTLGPQGISRSDDWTITALEVSPLVRRVIVDREGTVNRIGLTVNVSHPRLADLRIKVIAPSGRAVEVDLGRERASSADDIRIPAAQLEPLKGEALPGTWSISIRDEATGVAGYLAGWNLTLNSQALIEDFQRGIGIPDPIEREAPQFWTSEDGRYAVARATQSDSARLWDLAFAKPVSAFAVTETEQLVGVDSGARRLVTATLDTVNLWDTTTGKRETTLPIGPASATARLTADGRRLVVQARSDVETRIEVWDLETAARIGELTIAGVPALTAFDATGQRVAVADYDRAVRVWDLQSGEQLVQFDLPQQPSEVSLSAGGETLGMVYGSSGVALWAVNRPDTPLLERFGDGAWRLRFSPSGARVLVGRPRTGYELHAAVDGRLIGPAIGISAPGEAGDLLAFNAGEDVVVTGSLQGRVRFWQLPVTTKGAQAPPGGDAIWTPAADAVVAALPDASAVLIADRGGNVHRLPVESFAEALAKAREDVSFLGHNAAVRGLTISQDGRLAASVAEDNTLRVWSTADGLPAPYIAELPGNVIERITFSPDGSLVGVLSATTVNIIDTATGDIAAELELGETHSDLAFGFDNSLYLGSLSGALNVMTRDASGVWSLRRLWQGEAPIRWLELSPRGRFLVLVDQNNLAQQFVLADGRTGELSLQLPSPVQEVTFSPNGSRVLFRTSRWVHRVGSSPSGLIWLQAMFVPDSLAGSRIVFGSDSGRASSGQAFYLPVAREGIVNLQRLQFDDASSPGLFGNRDTLLDEWQQRLAFDTTTVEETQ
ncbi:MAG: AAA-like domain-containing protein [Woeseiaceae bacterium]|nr:AAA-like domain-containing protein [Woeseiaceae bacterium]